MAPLTLATPVAVVVFLVSAPRPASNRDTAGRQQAGAVA